MTNKAKSMALAITLGLTSGFFRRSVGKNRLWNCR